MPFFVYYAKIKKIVFSGDNMKDLGFVRDVVGTKDDVNHHIYEANDGIFVRDVVIDAGIGKEVTIGVVSDLHLNYVNQQDFDEANPVIMASYEKRKWLAGGESVPMARRCLEAISDCDQMIVNGDTLDFLTHGAMELMDREVWDKYPNVLASLGGHECTRRMQSPVEDPTTIESRFEVLQEYWRHDIHYVSRLVGEKVICVVMNNSQGTFYDHQIEPLKKDIELAKEKGYVILVFFHEPINTGNPNDAEITMEMALLVGDKSSYPKNFYDGQGCGNRGTEANKTVYNLIINNAEVVKGVFAGHKHSDFCLEILGHNSDGTEAIIPQYVTTATAYHRGHLLRATVK